jgi:hypothetical protein
MITVEPHNVEVLRSRFSAFYDGVVCGVTTSLDRKSGHSIRTCMIDLECKDQQAENEWSLVRLTIFEVSEFRFQLSRKRVFEVLSGGIQFVWQDGKLYVVLDAYPDDGPQLPDLSASIAYVVGTRCTVQVTSIPTDL